MGLVFRQCAFFCALVYVGKRVAVHIDIVIGEEGGIRIVIRDYIVVIFKRESSGIVFNDVYVRVGLTGDILRLIENDGAVISAANCYFAAHHVLRDKTVYAALKIKVSVYFAVSDYCAVCLDGDVALDLLPKENGVLFMLQKQTHQLWLILHQYHG